MQRQIAFFMPGVPSMFPRSTARAAALCFLATMAALIAFVGSGPALGHPASEADGSRSIETTAQELPVIETVWSANMTVGQASDSTESYTGYLPGLSSPEGDLDVTEFTYKDVQYTILGIFQQEFGPTVKQLVFNADVPLDDVYARELRRLLHRGVRLQHLRPTPFDPARWHLHGVGGNTGVTPGWAGLGDNLAIAGAAL